MGWAIAEEAGSPKRIPRRISLRRIQTRPAGSVALQRLALCLPRPRPLAAPAMALRPPPYPRISVVSSSRPAASARRRLRRRMPRHGVGPGLPRGGAGAASGRCSGAARIRLRSSSAASPPPGCITRLPRRHWRSPFRQLRLRRPLRLAVERPKGVTVNTALRDALSKRSGASASTSPSRPLRHHAPRQREFERRHQRGRSRSSRRSRTTRPALFACCIHSQAEWRLPVTSPPMTPAAPRRCRRRPIVRVLNPMTAEEADRPASIRSSADACFGSTTASRTWRRRRARRLAAARERRSRQWRLRPCRRQRPGRGRLAAPGTFEKVTEQHLCEVQRRMGDEDFSTVATGGKLAWVPGWSGHRHRNAEPGRAGTVCARSSRLRIS